MFRTYEELRHRWLTVDSDPSNIQTGRCRWDTRPSPSSHQSLSRHRHGKKLALCLAVHRIESVRNCDMLLVACVYDWELILWTGGLKVVIRFVLKYSCDSGRTRNMGFRLIGQLWIHQPVFHLINYRQPEMLAWVSMRHCRYIYTILFIL